MKIIVVFQDPDLGWWWRYDGMTWNDGTKPDAHRYVFIHALQLQSVVYYYYVGL